MKAHWRIFQLNQNVTHESFLCVNHISKEYTKGPLYLHVRCSVPVLPNLLLNDEKVTAFHK